MTQAIVVAALYKFVSLPDFEALLTQAGFARGESWTDDARRFAVVWAPAAAAPR